MKSVDQVILPVNKISKPFHVLFAKNNSYLECTRFLVDTNSFQGLNLKYGKAQLDLWDAINSLSSIQVLPGGKVIALTLSYTFFQLLHIGLAQNNILQSMHLPRQFVARLQAIFYTFILHPYICSHFKVDMLIQCVLVIILNQNLLLHFAILLFLLQLSITFAIDELRFVYWHFVRLFVMINLRLRFCFRHWNPFSHHFHYLQWSFNLYLPKFKKNSI